MPAMRHARYFGITVGALALALQPTLAYADWPPGGQTQFPSGSPSGQVKGHDISATAGAVRFSTSKNSSGRSTGGLTATGDWLPPACWYAPAYTPQQFKRINEGVWREPSVGNDWANTQRDRYLNGKPYKNFNLAKTGKGYWWTAVPNPDRLTDPSAFSCNKPDFWVDNGQPSPVPNSITPQMLAELAYAKIRVPDTNVNLNPTGEQTVNLNTWAWLDRATFKPVSVTAAVNLLNIKATTTATPVALHLDPGTADATVYPASGDCPINPNGSIGAPYTKADGNSTPPCGLTYLRATTGTGPYPLKATITWKISWTGTGGTGGALPDGTFGSTTPITVQEVQTVVR